MAERVGRPPTGLSVHVYPSPIEHETRILKVTKTMVTRSIAERVLVVGTAKPGLAREVAIDAARSVRRVGTTLSGERLAGRILRFAEWSARVFFLLRRQPVSMVNCHSLSVLPLCAALKWWHRSLLVYEPHELETETETSVGLRRRLAKVVERLLIGAADRLIVVSDSIAREYARAYGLDGVVVVFNAPALEPDGEPATNRSLRDRFGIPDNHLVFMFQGVFDEGRGVRTLVDAFRLLPPDRHLVLMGFGPLEEEVRTAAQAHPNIHFLPAVPPESVAHHTRGADVGFALLVDNCLNHRCALPNKFFHYLHAGLPVIVSDLPEMGAVVERYACGWRVGGDVASVAAVVASIGPADLAPRRAGARRGREAFNWDREENKLVATYDALLSRG